MTLRFSLFQLSIVLLMTICMACGSDAGIKADSTNGTEVISTPKVDAVTGYIDPACQMKVSPDASITHTHEGVTYGFCGEGCKTAFAKDPATFLAALEE